MQRNCKFKYGSTYLDFEMPNGVVFEELIMRKTPVLAHPERAIAHAINHPIASPPLKKILKPGQTVVIIVNDLTRSANSHVFMPILLDECNNAGIPDSHITVLFALGVHREMTETEMRASLGDAAADRVKRFNSNARNKKDFLSVGTTSRGTEVFSPESSAMRSYYLHRKYLVPLLRGIRRRQEGALPGRVRL